MKIAVNGKKIELKDKKLQQALDDHSNGDFFLYNLIHIQL